MPHRFKHIWIIDDSEMDMLVATRMLQLAGFKSTLTSFYIASVALKALEENQNLPENLPDLILLDRSMPAIDGMQFIAEYEAMANELQKKSAIVLISAGTSYEDQSKLNANPYVLKVVDKPLSMDTIASIVAAVEETA